MLASSVRRHGLRAEKATGRRAPWPSIAGVIARGAFKRRRKVTAARHVVSAAEIEGGRRRRGESDAEGRFFAYTPPHMQPASSTASARTCGMWPINMNIIGSLCCARVCRG